MSNNPSELITPGATIEKIGIYAFKEDPEVGGPIIAIGASMLAYGAFNDAESEGLSPDLAAATAFGAVLVPFIPTPIGAMINNIAQNIADNNSNLTPEEQAFIKGMITSGASASGDVTPPGLGTQSWVNAFENFAQSVSPALANFVNDVGSLYNSYVNSVQNSGADTTGEDEDPQDATQLGQDIDNLAQQIGSTLSNLANDAEQGAENAWSNFVNGIENYWNSLGGDPGDSGNSDDGGYDGGGGYGGGGLIGGLIGALKGLFGKGGDRSDPLVIDLTGNGLNLTALSSTSPYYDYSGDGFATQTGWVGTGSGFLVIQNADGSVQMLGNDSISGIAALDAAFGGSSGTITASNPLFSQLMVWEDTNGNAQVDAGELYTLQDLGITSISLSETASGEVINGNTVAATLTYTMADGQTGVIGEVDFATDPTASTPDVTVTIPTSIASLPQLNGYGKLYDLQSAMVLDPTLLGMVQNFVALPTTSSTATIDAAVQAILYEWAGVEDVIPGSLGGYANAQQVGFLEAYLGENYYQPSHNTVDPSPFGGADLSMAWNDALNGLTARLVLQSPLAAEIPEFQYDASIDMVLPVSGDFSDAIASMEQRLGTPVQANFDSWYLGLQVIDASGMDLNLTSDQIYQLIAQGASDSTTQMVAALEAAVAAGQTISFAADGSFVITGTMLNDTMYAGPGISKLIGDGQVAAGDNGSVYIGPNTDTTNGDVFVYNAGDGHVEIDEAPVMGPDNYPSQATLVLGAGITPDQISMSQDAQGDVFLTIDSAGDVVQIDNQRLSGTPNYDGVQDIEFSDGTTWTAQQLGPMLDIGSADNTMLYGSQSASTFNSEGYATYAQGYGAGDTFIFDVGYGSLEINEQNYSQLNDNILTFGSGINPSDVSISTGLSGAIILTIGTSGDAVTLDNMLDGPQYGVESVEFADGSIWSAQNIVAGLSLATGASASSYFDIAQLGETQSSSELPNLIYLGLTNPSDLLFQADSAGDLTISTDGYASDDIVLADDLYGNAQSQAERVLFADGSTLSLEGGLNYTWIGTEAATTLVGANWGANTFDLAPGSDQITFGNSSQGGNGANTVNYASGDGTVTVDLNGSGGAIALGAGITASDLYFQSDAAGDLTIGILGADGMPGGDTIITDGALYPYNYNGWSVGSAINLQFADGSSLAITGAVTDSWWGPAGNTTLVGSDWSANQFESLASGDTVVFGNGAAAGYRNAASTQNIVDYDAGDGTVTVDTDGVAGGIQLGTGISAANVAFQLNPDNSLDVEFLDANGDPTNDVLSIDSIYDVSYVDLADGTFLNVAGNLTIFGTSGDDSIAAWASGDTIVSGAGDDFLKGSSGSNTFVYDWGYGDDYIDAYSMGNSGSTLLMGPGITASDLTFSRGGGGSNWDLLVSVAGAGVIQIGAELSQRPISEIDFSDGTSMSLAGPLTYSATAAGQTVAAWESGDTLVDDYGDGVLQGTGGSNTFDYNFGDGNEYISAYSVGNSGSNIVVGPGITASDVTFQRGGGGPNWDLIVDIAGSGTIQIGAELSQRPISEIDFLDGTSINLTGNLVFSANGAGQTVTPWTNGDTLTSGGFANSTLAGSGDAVDYLFDAGDGDVTVANSNDASQLDFGPGISDSQLWFTQSGNDLLINIIGSQDQVDVENWFSGGQNAQLAEINDASGNAIGSGLNQLIAAMATFETNNQGFNPETAMQMPNDNNLQAAIITAWHSQTA